MERKSIERLVSIQSRKPLDFSALTAVDSIEEAGKPDGGGCWRPDSVCARAIVPPPAQTRATIVAICATFSFITRRYKTRIWSASYIALWSYEVGAGIRSGPLFAYRETGWVRRNSNNVPAGATTDLPRPIRPVAAPIAAPAAGPPNAAPTAAPAAVLATVLRPLRGPDSS